MTPLSMWKNKYAVYCSQKNLVSQVSLKELKMLSWHMFEHNGFNHLNHFKVTASRHFNIMDLKETHKIND